MSKYKCIKTWPGGPCVGYVSNPKIGLEHYWASKFFDPKDWVEFWELIIEEDLEEVNKIKYSLKNIENAVKSFNWGPFTFDMLKNALNNK